MSTQRNKNELAAKISDLKVEVALAEAEMYAFDSALYNNQYSSHDHARTEIENRYEGIADQDCEGAHNCGQSEYKQLYQISDNPNTFEATVSFEYNRHDKTYYYIDGQSYGFVMLELAAAEVKS